MNRLTKRTKDGIAYTEIPLNQSTVSDENGNIIWCRTGFIADRLAAYEDTGLEPEELQEFLKRIDMKDLHDHISELLELEEQGILIKLPCKVGDNLFLISNRVDGKGHVRRLMLTHNNMGNILSRLGNDVYATREEAEKVLEEMNGTPGS